MVWVMKRPWRTRLVIIKDGPYGRKGTVLTKNKEPGEVGQYLIWRRVKYREALNSEFTSIQHSENGENWS